MISARVEVKFNHIPNLVPALDRRVAEICEGAAFACEGLAKAFAPIDTGFLRSSIQASPESRHSWVVGVGADYGIHQEFGTSNMAAHPFMTPAAENVRPTFLGQMQNVVNEVAQ